MKIFNAVLEKFNKIKITVDDFTQFRSYKFIIRNGNSQLSINKYSVIENDVNLILDEEVNIKSECYIMHEGLIEKVLFFPLFLTTEFHNRFYHDSTMGAIYNNTHTIFRVWSPAASKISLLLYNNTDNNNCNSEDKRRIAMKETNGLWSVLVKGDLHGHYYNYEVEVYGNINEVVDPYTKAVGINGTRGAILNLSKTSPENWECDVSPRMENYTDAIIYETSIRDISTHLESGTKNKGKFLALTENSRLSSQNASTCLNHIKELGITHIQFMPIFDFSYTSVDERYPYNYNWGYDPQNYNVPEGIYSTDPYDPACRILELKKMIRHLHQNNISINMDVVYNHISDAINSNFEKIFPGYYFRYSNNGSLSNGSGCGNDTASEHSMMRKFIIDSVLYWAEEYHVDGFRFDLMGLHDVTTMNLIREKLNELKRPIMLYGEGWDLNTPLDKNIKATIYNSEKLPRIGFFNDKIRDYIKGDVFNIGDRGFATGKPLMEEKLKECILGKFLKPEQSINYVSCHDNFTLWDKIDLSCKNESLDDKKKMVKLCAAIILTSPGTPFIYSGEEFCRTKNGEHNSYNKSDAINWIDWNRKSEFIDVFNYYKELINIRKNHPAFRMINIKDIKTHLSFMPNTPKNTVAFILKDNANGDNWREILVIFNANKEEINIGIPKGEWHIALNNDLNTTNKTIFEDSFNVSRISACILYRL